MAAEAADASDASDAATAAKPSVAVSGNSGVPASEGNASEGNASEGNASEGNASEGNSERGLDVDGSIGTSAALNRKACEMTRGDIR